MGPIEKLAKIKAILRQEYVKDGLNILDDCYYNLEAIIQEIQAGKPSDEITLSTLNNVQSKVAEIYEILNEPDTYEDSPLTTDITPGFDALTINEHAHGDDSHEAKEAPANQKE